MKGYCWFCKGRFFSPSLRPRKELLVKTVGGHMADALVPCAMVETAEYLAGTNWHAPRRLKHG